MRTAQLVVVGVALFAFTCVGAEPSGVVPLERAHSHNDYEHPRPLLDALDRGFCSVEADIYLIDGKLLVAHDRDKVKPERTLEALYLEPLRNRVKRNGGRVFRSGPPVTLLIDFKTEAEATYAALSKVLAGYAEILTVFTPDSTETNAVTVVISGNRPRATMLAEKRRYAAFDGRLADLEGRESRHFIPLVSESWRTAFAWRGFGPLPTNEQVRLKQLVDKAHGQGRRIRFWAIPDRPEAWTILFDSGVDLINTDNLDGLRDHLIEKAK